MSEERRISDRIDTPSGQIHVFDRMIGEEIGTVANISTTGFMLVADRHIEVDSIFQLRLLTSDTEEEFILGAICLWNSDASAANTFWAGFHIIDISEETLSRLDKLIAPQYGG